MNSFITEKHVKELYSNIYKILNHNQTKIESLQELDLELILDERKWEDYDATQLGKWIKVSLEEKVSEEDIKESLKDWYEKSTTCTGIRLELKGRINGVELATKSIFILGKPNKSSYQSNIDYAEITAQTKSGSIGIKLWLSY